MSEYTYIPSTAGEPFAWCCYTTKCSRTGVVYAQATEGRKAPGSFETAYGGPEASRQRRYTTQATRATAKAKDEAMQGLLTRLRNEGLIV